MAIREAEDKFHQNFQVGYKAHPLGYMGVNLSISTTTQSKARARARARMLAKNLVPAWLQQPTTNYPTTNCWGRGGEGGEGTTKQSKSKKGVGGSKTFPTWKGGFEVQEESNKERKRKQINVKERKISK